MAWGLGFKWLVTEVTSEKILIGIPISVTGHWLISKVQNNVIWSLWMFAGCRLQVLALKWIETAKKLKTIKWCWLTKIPAISEDIVILMLFCVIYCISDTRVQALDGLCGWLMSHCVFVLRLNVPVNNFSVMSGRRCLIGPNIWQHGHLIKLRN